MVPYQVVRYGSRCPRSTIQKRVLQIADFANRHSLAVCAYEVNHLFDQFRIVFTHGVQKWIDADILIYGEWHARDDLTRGFVSNWAPTKRLLMCIEGTPSMQPADDQQSLQDYYFDGEHVKYRDSWFIGWDAEEHLMPQGNCAQTNILLLSQQHQILNEVDGVYLRLITLYKLTQGEDVDDGFGAMSIDQLRTFATQYSRLATLCKKFKQEPDRSPLVYLTTVYKKTELLLKILGMNYVLKTLYPNCWSSSLEEQDVEIFSLELQKIKDWLQQLRIPLLDAQMELTKGLESKGQIRETFPYRTAAMSSTIRSIGQWIGRGMQEKPVLIAGAAHVETRERNRGQKEYCLDVLYEELRNHKVAVISQNN